MAIAAFDTLKYSKRLKNSGFSDLQAEALAEAQAEAFESNFHVLATKADLKILASELKGEMLLLKWMLGIMTAGIISLVLKAFFI